MAVKTVKPTSPGRRFQTYPTFEEITRTTDITWETVSNVPDF
jgi:ribosomal protein L2